MQAPPHRDRDQYPDAVPSRGHRARAGLTTLALGHRHRHLTHAEATAPGFDQRFNSVAQVLGRIIARELGKQVSCDGSEAGGRVGDANAGRTGCDRGKHAHRRPACARDLVRPLARGEAAADDHVEVTSRQRMEEHPDLRWIMLPVGIALHSCEIAPAARFPEPQAKRTPHPEVQRKTKYQRARSLGHWGRLVSGAVINDQGVVPMAAKRLDHRTDSLRLIEGRDEHEDRLN